MIKNKQKLKIKKFFTLSFALIILINLVSIFIIKAQVANMPDTQVGYIDINNKTLTTKMNEQFNLFDDSQLKEANEYIKNQILSLDNNFEEKIKNNEWISQVEKSIVQTVNLENGISIRRENTNETVYVEPDNTFFLHGIDNTKLLSLNIPTDEEIIGRRFTEEEILQNKNVIMISDEVAQNNNLNVGDKIIILIPTYQEHEQIPAGGAPTIISTVEQQVEIIGVYPKFSRDHFKMDMSAPFLFVQQLKTTAYEKPTYYFLTSNKQKFADSIKDSLPEIYEVF